MPRRGGRPFSGVLRRTPLTAEREALELRWRERRVAHDDLAPLVTGQQLRDEPFHRWLPYKQAFAPELVRRFLAEAGPAVAPERPVLDPFSGAGTLAIECARRDVPARGVEALDVLAFLARARSARSVPPLPELPDDDRWESYVEQLTNPVHQAALIFAEAQRHTASGHLNRQAAPLQDVLIEIVDRMRTDVATPLPRPVEVTLGDARLLDGVDDATIAGILTSPPYLSRYDYTRTTAPLERVYRSWTAQPGSEDPRARQVRAHPRAVRRARAERLTPAAQEAVDDLRARRQGKLAGIVHSYFEDMTAALRACRRVLAPGAPCWLVIGGARLKEAYVPSDTILAEVAEGLGLAVEEIRVARALTADGRRFGLLGAVAPRESIVVLHRPGG
jgi:hypothetical protein